MSALAFAVPQLLALAAGSFAVSGAFRGMQSRTPATIAHGYVTGVVLGAMSLYLAGIAGLGVRFWPAAAIQTVLAVMLGLLIRWITRPDEGKAQSVIERPVRGVATLVLVVLLVLLVARAASVGVDATTLPLYPWDAWQQWGTKARVWFETHELRPFVSPSAWLVESAQTTVYTDANPAYPPLVPMLQVWTLGFSTAWNDAVTGITWLGLFCAFGTAFAWHVHRLLPHWGYAIAATYVVLSLPFLDTHIALAGYGDFPLSVLYCLAFMSATAYLRHGRRGDATMALLFVAMLPFFKRPGIAWALTLLPFAATVVPQTRRALFLRLLMIGAAVVVVVLIAFRVLNAPVTPLAESVWSVALNLFGWENWHLLWYVAVPVLVWHARRASWRSPDPPAAALVLAALFLAWAFWGTELYASIANVTTLNRALLPFACALCYFLALVAAPAVEQLLVASEPVASER